MGQVDEGVRQAGERQASEEAGGAYEPPPTGPAEAPPQPDYTYVDARPRLQEQQVQVGESAPGPLAMLAKLRHLPWYVWLGVGALGLVIASVVQEERASKNPDEDDDDTEEDPSSDDDISDEDEDEEDPDLDDFDEDFDDDDDAEDSDEPDDDEAYANAPRSPRRARPRKSTKRDRVIPDNEPDQESAESVLGDE